MWEHSCVLPHISHCVGSKPSSTLHTSYQTPTSSPAFPSPRVPKAVGAFFYANFSGRSSVPPPTQLSKLFLLLNEPRLSPTSPRAHIGPVAYVVSPAAIDSYGGGGYGGGGGGGYGKGGGGGGGGQTAPLPILTRYPPATRAVSLTSRYSRSTPNHWRTGSFNSSVCLRKSTVATLSPPRQHLCPPLQPLPRRTSTVCIPLFCRDSLA